MDKDTLRAKIIGANLNRQQKYIMLLMSEYSTEGTVALSENYLAHISRYSVGRVRNTIQGLEVGGVLERVSKHGWNGTMNACNAYRIQIENARQMPSFETRGNRGNK